MASCDILSALISINNLIIIKYSATTNMDFEQKDHAKPNSFKQEDPSKSLDSTQQIEMAIINFSKAFDMVFQPNLYINLIITVFATTQ